MRRFFLFLVLGLSGCLGDGDGQAVQPSGSTLVEGVHFEAWVEGLDQPTHMTRTTSDASRFWVTEQAGRVRLIVDGSLRATPYLDLRGRVGSAAAEQGLLSFALHPSFAQNGYVYASYTDTHGDSVIERFTADTKAETAPTFTGHVIMRVDQPHANHNGGLITFGPDGKLWIGWGDGGSAGDPDDRAQDPNELLGKILRIDVDAKDPYGIPSDNPFPNTVGTRPEIWATGVRNPWRFSFSEDGKQLFIADVGQNEWEEVDVLRVPDDAGANLGWRLYEGSHPYRAGSLPDRVDPVAEYPNAGTRCSITGGHVYTGTTVANLQGAYVFGDYCSGEVWTLAREDGAWAMHALVTANARPTSFALDAQGELYLVDHGGRILRLAPGPA